MYSEVGWIDTDMVPQGYVITEDISTLPAEMSEALLGVEFDRFVTEQCNSRKCLEKNSLKPDSQLYFKVLL